jgi:hypothetical protein
MSMTKYKKGMVLQSKASNTIITLTNRASGNRHWNTRKRGSKNNHKVHEQTLDKFYEVLKKTQEENSNDC